MNVKRLKQLIANLPDETPLLVSAPDHSYRECVVAVTTALYDAKTRAWSEDYGEAVTPEADFGKRMRVLFVA